MRVEIMSVGNWAEVYEAARVTRGAMGELVRPPDDWVWRILLAEHSPIRAFHVTWRWIGIPYWVSVHFVRHHVGISHFVRTQREDLTGVPRSSRSQVDPVIHQCVANAQAILNISRKRLCGNASPETRDAWRTFLRALAKEGQVPLVACCVPECVYRGFCPEMKSCGYAQTSAYAERRDSYRERKADLSCLGT